MKYKLQFYNLCAKLCLSSCAIILLMYLELHWYQNILLSKLLCILFSICVANVAVLFHFCMVFSLLCSSKGASYRDVAHHLIPLHDYQYSQFLFVETLSTN
jgi:hypothetical protein